MPSDIVPRNLQKSATAARTRALGVAGVLLFCAGSPVAHAGQVSVGAETQSETGIATYYSKRFEGRRTASGHTFRHSELIAAHAFYPFGTLVRVTNLRNGSTVDVRITDRGGFARRGGNLIIDLSRAAAARLDMITGGRARVLVEVLGKSEQKVHAAADAAQVASAGE